MTRSDVRTVQESVGNHFFRAFSMRRWLTRSLWLAAWSFWLWLGFGLYRELPRDLGRVIFHHPNADEQFVVGFVDHSPQLVGCFHDWNPAGHELWVWDPDEQTMAKQHFASLPTVPWNTASPGREFGVVPARMSEGRWDPSFAFDFRSAARRTLPIQGFAPIFHPQKPWALFTSVAETPNGPYWIKAFELRTGRPIFEWQSATRPLKYIPFFIGDDRIGMVLDADKKNPESDASLEVWTLPQADAPTHQITPFEIGHDAVASTDGRIAWHRDSAVTVFDITAKREVFTEPLATNLANERPTSAFVATPLLSEDGQAVLAPISATLFEIDTGRVLWRGGVEDLIVGDKDNRQFETEEVWRIDLGRWTRSFKTFAVRSLRDGALAYRSWTPSLNLFARDDGGHGFILTDEGVRALPPRVNWMPLALCQAILALPLVLLWAVLRWRRKPGG
jgi:hypothetical protein